MHVNSPDGLLRAIKFIRRWNMAFSSIFYLWNKWNIRSFVLLSLLLQIFLVLFSPVRKKTANNRVIFLLWLAYLMADWVAAFAIGLISHNQGNLFAHSTEVDGALRAFWASFLLLHLGGPDTITAFSLEDSSLWRRHLLSRIFQISAAIYVFAQIFPSDKSLMIPTMLVFLVAVIKNAERTLALNLSSLPKLREWVLSQHEFSFNADHPEYESLFFVDSKRVSKIDGIWRWLARHMDYFGEDEAEIHESIMVELAYHFFHIFKVFLGDLMFTHREREMSHKCLTHFSAMDALRLISIELQFMYEVLHTKALAIHSNLSYIFRFITFMGVVVAFVLFNHLKKHQLNKLDVKITYILLFGGIALDVIALFMLIFSNWTVAKIMQNNSRSSKLYSFMYKLVYTMNKLRKPRYATCEAEPNANVTYEALDTPLIFRRWSESISACNLLSMSLKENPRKMYKHEWSLGSIASSNLFNFPLHMAKKIIYYFHQAGETISRGCGLRTTKGETAMIVNTNYVSINPFIKKLWIFIFKEVRRKSRNINEPEVIKIFEARGDLFLKSRADEIDCGDLLEDVTETTYDDNIIIWHIATEIWYNIEKSTKKKDERQFSKILSDYMLYLLLNQPNLMSAVEGIAQITAGETLKELELPSHPIHSIQDVEGLRKFLRGPRLPPLTPTESWKSMLTPGINLALKMGTLREMKWEVMSGVWVEMLSYAAIHIKGEAHVQVLSKGGELLAFIWLLMAHFGCAYKPELGVCDPRYLSG